MTTADHACRIWGQEANGLHPNPRTMTTTLALLLALLLLPVLILLWATESTEQRARRLHRNGWSQRRIADHMNITRYRVRVALAA